MLSPLPDTKTSDFSAGLLAPTEPTPAQVTGPQGKQAHKRYDVYRNNVTVSLINAMADIYPAVQRIVGEDFFRAVAREYVRVHPPKSPLLFLYGEHFAPFLETFEHTQHLPYLPDVARLERAWLTAYHAADVAQLDPATLATVTPEQTGQLQFVAKPGTAIITSGFPVFTIYAMNRDLLPLGQVDVSISEIALITRPDADVIVTPLGRADAIFVSHVIERQSTLEVAAAAALEAAPGFNINEALAMLFGTGAASAFHLSSPTSALDENTNTDAQTLE